MTQVYWPEVRTAPLNLAALAENLQRRGHRVTVLTGFPNHPFGRVYEGYRMSLCQEEHRGGVRIIRLPLFPDHSLSLVRRATNYCSFALSLTLLGTFLTRRAEFDAIFAYLPPLTIGLPVFLISRIHRAPIVYWMTDLWPENLLASGAPVHPIMYKAVRCVENQVYKSAKIVSMNSPGFVANLKSKGVKLEKLEIVTDWADENVFFPVDYDQELAGGFGLAGKFNVMYAGNIGKVQGLEVMVEAAKRMKDMTDIQFVLIGDGTELGRLKRLVAAYGLQNIKFIPRQPLEQMRRFFAIADVLLVHLNREPVFEMQLPSKIIAYMACGRPVLCAMHGEARKMIEEEGVGLCCLSEDTDALSALVRKFYDMPLAAREEMGRNAREAYLKNYTRQIQVDRVERLLMKAAGT